ARRRQTSGIPPHGLPHSGAPSGGQPPGARTPARCHGPDCCQDATMHGMNAAALAGPSARARLAWLADPMVLPIALVLPWSTSATAIGIVLWLLLLLPAVDPAALRRELATLAGALPVLFWVLDAIGMLYADVSWADAIEGQGGYHKLLCIPL